MSFADRETSRTRGTPIALFRFGWGENVVGYTSSEKPVTFDDESAPGGELTYMPIPVERTPITSSGTLDKSTTTIRLPINLPIVDLFRVFPPSDVVGITVFQGHHNDPEFLAIFVGRVLSCGRKGRIASLNCEPASTSMRRPGLRRRWQYTCPHVLYGPQCRLSRDAFTYTAQVASVSGTYVTMQAGWNGAKAKSSFENGLFQWTGENGVELRNILQVNDDILLVSGRVSGLPSGTTVKVTLGCRHTMDDCLDVFNNIHNFGGDPWIPLANPIGSVNRFY